MKRLIESKSSKTFSVRLCGVFISCLMAACGPASTRAAADPDVFDQLDPAAKTEFVDATNQMRTLTAVCGNALACVEAYLAPFGPAYLVPGEPFASQDLQRTNDMQNRMFGAVMAMNGVSEEDAVGIPNRFHCGPPCLDRRRDDLAAHLPALSTLAKDFDVSGLQVVALWPDDAIRVDDRIYGPGGFSLRRTPYLHMQVASRTRDAVVVSPSVDVARMAQTLKDVGAIAIARDRFGVRVIHRESIGDNEMGLLFTTPQRAASIDPGQLPDGGRYQWVKPLRDGVYFYVRT